jgi:hypothetical protein
MNRIQNLFPARWAMFVAILMLAGRVVGIGQESVIYRFGGRYGI